MHIFGRKIQYQFVTCSSTDRAPAVRAGISPPHGQRESMQDRGIRMDAATVWQRLADGRQAENMERQYSQAAASLRLCSKLKKKATDTFTC